jgi:hypothetical protein
LTYNAKLKLSIILLNFGATLCRLDVLENPFE